MRSLNLGPGLASAIMVFVLMASCAVGMHDSWADLSRAAAELEAPLAAALQLDVAAMVFEAAVVAPQASPYGPESPPLEPFD